MIIRRLAIATLMAVGMVGCSGNTAPEQDAAAEEKLQVVTTFSILGDMVAEIGGDAVAVHSIVPLGVDPHEYSPLPLDLQKSSDADLMFFNGLNMETGGNWFEALVDISGKELDSPQVREVSLEVAPMYLVSEDGSQDEINPHAFLDPNVGTLYAQSIRDALVETDPDNEAQYVSNATKYLGELEEIDELYREKIAEIPAQHRVLVTSEHAYQYMTEQYGLTPGYIWEIDTDEQGTPEQINNLVNLIRTSEVPALFIESNKDPRPMETVSKETGVPIYGTIFSDELGQPDKDGGTYLKMLRFNIEQIHAGLS